MPVVQTVLGPIDASDLGATMSHVHLTIDILCWHMPYGSPELAKEAEGEFALGKLGAIRRNGGSKLEAGWNPTGGTTFGFGVIAQHRSGRLTLTPYTRPAVGPAIAAHAGKEVVIGRLAKSRK